jgi:hypothetical protein
LYVCLGSLRVLAEFVRKQRAFAVALRQSSAHTRDICVHGGSYVSNLLVCMKAQIMGDEDVDDMCDAYAPLGTTWTLLFACTFCPADNRGHDR